MRYDGALRDAAGPPAGIPVRVQEPRWAAADGSFLALQFPYSEHVRYVEQLRRFERYFTRERMLLIVYDDFRADNEATVRAVQRFLGIDDTLPIEPVQSNPMKTVRSLSLHRLRNAVGRAEADPSSVGALTRTLTTLVPRRVRSGALAAAVRRLAYAAPTPADEKLMLELRRRFRPEVVALGEYLGCDLVAEWG